MKKILVISSRVPYPLTAGYRIRIFNTAKYLSQCFQVDLMCLSEAEVDKQTIDELEKVFNNVTVIKTGKIHCLAKSVLGIFNQLPLQVNYYRHGQLKTLIEQQFAQYDLVIANHIRTAEYVKDLDLPKLLDLHDAISLNYRRAKQELTGIKRWLYSFEEKRVLQYERMIVDKFDYCTIVSDIDRDYLIKQGAAADKIITVPVAVRDDITVDQTQPETNIISFLGKMSYAPNEDAVIWFVHEIFPQLKARYADLQFYIIGIEPTKKVKELAKYPGVVVTGFVDNPFVILNQSQVVVAPIRIGAGVQNKILEAMSIGKTVVTTRMGAEGICGQDGVHFLVADSSEEFTAQVCEAINNPLKRNAIGKAAQKLIAEHYTWPALSKQFYALIDQLI